MRIAAALVVFVLACGSRPEPAAEPAPEPARATPAAGDRPERPRLVVVIVLDQLGAWVFDRYRDRLDPDGLLRTGIARGALYTGRYPYAGTYTAVGHATLYTGVGPTEHGVVSNNVWDRAAGRKRSIFDDGEHPIPGHEGAFAGPGALRVDTVADALHAATAGDAVIASLSLKDRGAIQGGGRNPDLVLWYDKALPGFTTSSYYGALPDWLVDWLAANPIEDRLGPWQPLDPDGYAALLGPDDGPGEGDLAGYGATFPHEPARTRAPYDLFRYSPASASYLIELAAETARQLDMGADAVPDLLALSISTTDYVGHTFGPDSWEYLDNLVRVDRELGALVRRLEAERGPIAVVVTSDHGQAPNPQISERAGHSAGRIFQDDLGPVLDRAVDDALGPGRWVDAFEQPYVYLGPDAEVGARRREVVAVLRPVLAGMPEVAAVYDVTDLVAAASNPDPVVRAAALSVHPQAQGDLFVIPARFTVVDDGSPRGAGTSHGTPYAYDQEVPLVLWGAGIGRTGDRTTVDQRRVAATIAALLGVTTPASKAEPLDAVAVTP